MHIKSAINVYPDQGCRSGSGRIWCFCMDPDPVFKFLWIRIRFHPENFQDRGVWIRIRFVLRGWIRIRIQPISDRIRNPGWHTSIIHGFSACSPFWSRLFIPFHCWPILDIGLDQVLLDYFQEMKLLRPPLVEAVNRRRSFQREI